MTKASLKKHYVKSYSSGWTKGIFTGLPILGAFTLPMAHGINSISSSKLSTDYLKKGISYINPLPYHQDKSLLSADNLKHVALGAFNLSMIAQSAHSLKNLIAKCQQDSNRIINVKINGNEQEIIAKGTLPISTYLCDILMIGGTAGYFAVDNTWGKIGCAAGGILGNLICKAVADDTSYEIDSTTNWGINNSIVNSNVNSNNTYIYNSNYGSTTNMSDEAAAAMALILAIAGVYKVGEMLINDSTPGLYQYKLCDKAGRSLKLQIEWDKDGYHLFDEYGAEIEVV